LFAQDAGRRHNGHRLNNNKRHNTLGGPFGFRVLLLLLLLVCTGGGSTVICGNGDGVSVVVVVVVVGCIVVVWAAGIRARRFACSCRGTQGGRRRGPRTTPASSAMMMATWGKRWRRRRFDGCPCCC